MLYFIFICGGHQGYLNNEIKREPKIQKKGSKKYFLKKGTEGLY